MAIYVFVYGTLRSGEINDLEKLAERLGLGKPGRLGQASTSGTLYDFGDWPGLVAAPGGKAIAGDVYAVDEALLAAMDAVEEYEPGQNTLFVRRSLRLEVDGQLLDCFFYPVDPAQLGTAVPIEHHDWVAYRKSRQIAKRECG